MMILVVISYRGTILGVPMISTLLPGTRRGKAHIDSSHQTRTTAIRKQKWRQTKNSEFFPEGVW